VLGEDDGYQRQVPSARLRDRDHVRLRGAKRFFPLKAVIIRHILHDTTLTTQHAQRAKLLLEGHKVIPKRTLASGYQFKHPQLEEALADVMKKK
jgi:hypothetical protein